MVKNVKSGGGRLRLTVLVALLAGVASVGAVHTVRVWRYERQLQRLGYATVEDFNASDMLPMSPEGPEADVEIVATCSFSHLVFGEKSGKVTLVIKPRPHARDQRESAVSYIYTHAGGQWHEVESYQECGAQVIP